MEAAGGGGGDAGASGVTDWGRFLATLTPGPCAACGARPGEGHRFRRCKRCRQADYCSEKCQRAHWTGGHRLVCVAPGAHANGGDAGATTPAPAAERAPAHVGAEGGEPAAGEAEVETWEALFALLTAPSTGEEGDAQRHGVDCGPAAAAQPLEVQHLAPGVGSSSPAPSPHVLHRLSQPPPHQDAQRMSAEERGREKARRRREQREMNAQKKEKGLQRSLRSGAETRRREKELHAEMNGQVIKMQYDVRTLSPGVSGYSGTGFALVSSKPTVFLLILVCFGLWALKGFHNCQWQTYDANCQSVAAWLKDHPLPLAGLETIAKISIFNTCLFYFGSCYSQYVQYFWRSADMAELIDDISLVLQVYFSQTWSRWNVLRYVLAAHAIFYWGLRWRTVILNIGDWNIHNTPDFKTFAQQLIEQRLLLQDEVDTLEHQDNNTRILNLMAWCIVALRRIESVPPPIGEKGNARLQTVSLDVPVDEDSPQKKPPADVEAIAMAQDIQHLVSKLHAHMLETQSWLMLPFPFFAYHFIQVLQICYMVILAYAIMTAGIGQWLSLPLYILALLPILITTEIANTMSSPFGTDLSDFNQDALINPLREECEIASSTPDPVFLDKIGSREWCPDIVSDPPLPRSNEPPGDIRLFLQRYEQRARVMRARQIQLESSDTSAHQGVLASIFAPLLGKTCGEICVNICRAMRGEWGLGKHKTDSTAASTLEGDSADFLLPGMPLPPTLGGTMQEDKGKASQSDTLTRHLIRYCDIRLQDEDMQALMKPKLDDHMDHVHAVDADAQSVSTTASVRHLNEVISELGFYMHAEISEVESIAKQYHKLFLQRTILNRRIDLLEERMVQCILKFVTLLETTDGARLHPSDVYIIQTQANAAHTETADAMSRKPLMQRVLEVEAQVVCGAHLPPGLSKEETAQMHFLSVEAGLPLARALSCAASSAAIDADLTAADSTERWDLYGEVERGTLKGMGTSDWIKMEGQTEHSGFARPLRLGDLRHGSLESSMLDSSCDGDSVDSPCTRDATPVRGNARLLPTLSMSARKLPHQSPVHQELLSSQLGADRLRRQASLNFNSSAPQSPSTASGAAAVAAAAAAAVAAASMPRIALGGVAARREVQEKKEKERSEMGGGRVRGLGGRAGGGGEGGGGGGDERRAGLLGFGTGGAGNSSREPFSASSSNVRRSSSPPASIKPLAPPRWEPPSSSSSLVMKLPARVADADRLALREESRLGKDGASDRGARGVGSLRAFGVGRGKEADRSGPREGGRGHVSTQLPSL